MSRDRVIAGIDIGSSKTCSVIASLNEEGRISVIGVSTVSSSGIKRGIVVDIDDAIESIADSLERAQRMAGYGISEAFITCNGTHISSANSHGVVAVANPDAEITDDDIVRVTEAARAISLPSSREIIHVLPRGFVVDTQEGIKDPLGMSGIRLEVETNIISGAVTALRNLVKCVQQVGVDVTDIVYTGFASAEAVLNNTEKELGTILIDIGGGTTSVIIYEGGSPVYSSVLPLGGRSVTNDLAIGLRTSLEIAEKVKISLKSIAGENDQIEEDNSEDAASLDFSSIGLDIEGDGISKKLLSDIVRARLREIFTLVALEVKKSGYRDRLPAGVVLCGGAAQTMDIEDVAKAVLRGPVRVAKPRGLTGLVEELTAPDYAAVVGLILYGAKLSGKRRGVVASAGGRLKKGVATVGSFFKSLLP